MRSIVGQHVFDEIRYVSLPHDTKPTNDTCAAIARLKHVERVYLGGRYRLVGDDGMRHIATLRKLQYLFIGPSSVSDRGVVYLLELPKLQRLSITYSPIGGEAVRSIQKMTTLRTLHIRNMPGLYDTNITDASVPIFKEMTHLSELGIHGTRISAEGLEEVRQSFNLRATF